MSEPPLVPLRDVMRLASAPCRVDPEDSYPIAGVFGFGRGMIQRPEIKGSKIASSEMFRISAGQFIYSRLKSFEGAFAVVDKCSDGYFVSNEFPVFNFDIDCVEPAFVGWYFRRPTVWAQLAMAGRGLGARRERLHPARLLEHQIPLPPLTQQRRIVERLDAVADRVSRHRIKAESAETELTAILRAAFDRVVAGAPRAQMGDVAPLVRRPVEINLEGSYPELGIRSFGRGTFHKPPLSGVDVGSKRLFEIAAGDLLFNIVFAWEGAVAIADPVDQGRFGSHRFLTCVPDPRRATARWLRYFFLSDEGLQLLGSASPGGAGRNRTLGLKALEAISVPMPSVYAQRWFDTLQEKVAAVRRIHAIVGDELSLLVPALLDQAFG